MNVSEVILLIMVLTAVGLVAAYMYSALVMQQGEYIDFMDIPADAVGEKYQIRSLQQTGAFVIGCSQDKDDYYFNVLVCNDGGMEFLELPSAATKIFIDDGSPHLEIISVGRQEDLMFRLYVPEDYEIRQIA